MSTAENIHNTVKQTTKAIVPVEGETPICYGGLFTPPGSVLLSCFLVSLVALIWGGRSFHESFKIIPDDSKTLSLCCCFVILIILIYTSGGALYNYVKSPSCAKSETEAEARH